MKKIYNADKDVRGLIEGFEYIPREVEVKKIKKDKK